MKTNPPADARVSYRSAFLHAPTPFPRTAMPIRAMSPLPNEPIGMQTHHADFVAPRRRRVQAPHPQKSRLQKKNCQRMRARVDAKSGAVELPIQIAFGQPQHRRPPVWAGAGLVEQMPPRIVTDFVVQRIVTQRRDEVHDGVGRARGRMAGMEDFGVRHRRFPGVLVALSSAHSRASRNPGCFLGPRFREDERAVAGIMPRSSELHQRVARDLPSSVCTIGD